MQCYAMLCYAILCYTMAMLCDAMLFDATLCYAMRCEIYSCTWAVSDRHRVHESGQWSPFRNKSGAVSDRHRVHESGQWSPLRSKSGHQRGHCFLWKGAQIPIKTKTSETENRVEVMVSSNLAPNILNPKLFKENRGLREDRKKNVEKSPKPSKNKITENENRVEVLVSSNLVPNIRNPKLFFLLIGASARTENLFCWKWPKSL